MCFLMIFWVYENVAAHGYRSLRFDDIWEMIQVDIPDFKKEIVKLLT